MRTLVTGASGHVGGALVPALLDAGHAVVVLTRDPARLAGRPWLPDVDVVVGDAADDDVLAVACTDGDAAYWLVHALDAGPAFAAADRATARAFARAARRAGVGRLVYLGGPRPVDEPLSAHLRSREEVGALLLASGVPTAVLRAAMVVGPGSASFELLRHTARLPLLPAPAWVRTRVQPVALRDVVTALVGCAGLPAGENRAFDVAGPDVMTYAELVQRYAAVAGLGRRWFVPVPVHVPALAAAGASLVAPVSYDLARALVESLTNTVVAAEDDLAGLIGSPPRLGFEDAVRAALAG
ncbi:NAD(P)H-binding protein [Klenkia marina]|uniref:NAD(P)H-binding protein n=1 Tax=Klenkia marina TaxID=1960309 RepID=UPI001402A09E|nr:NAD(P)H-binding protein [Klenkia marina]